MGNSSNPRACRAIGYFCVGPARPIIRSFWSCCKWRRTLFGRFSVERMKGSGQNFHSPELTPLPMKAAMSTTAAESQDQKGNEHSQNGASYDASSLSVVLLFSYLRYMYTGSQPFCVRCHHPPRYQTRVLFQRILELRRNKQEAT